MDDSKLKIMTNVLMCRICRKSLFSVLSKYNSFMSTLNSAQSDWFKSLRYILSQRHLRKHRQVKKILKCIVYTRK